MAALKRLAQAAWLLAPALAWAQGAAGNCPSAPAGATLLQQGPLQLHWLPEPAPVVVSKPFGLRLQVCPTRAELLRLDARMPEHRHGMNYRPTWQTTAPGQWLAEGLVWHMPGRWELLLVLRLDGQEHRLVQSVVLR